MDLIGKVIGAGASLIGAGASLIGTGAVAIGQGIENAFLKQESKFFAYLKILGAGSK